MKSIDKQLDESWSKLIKLITNNKCEYCGSENHPNAHHIYSRANKSVRWLPDNGVCLCAKHHALSAQFSAHLTPVEFTEWLYKNKGENFMMTLKIKANSIGKYHKFEKELILKSIKSEINRYDKSHIL